MNGQTRRNARNKGSLTPFSPSQFPSGTDVQIWTGSGYNTFRSNGQAWAGGTPVISPNEGFFVKPSQQFSLTIPGVTGSPADSTYSLSNATVTVGDTTRGFTLPALAEGLYLERDGLCGNDGRQRERNLVDRLLLRCQPGVDRHLRGRNLPRLHHHDLQLARANGGVDRPRGVTHTYTYGADGADGRAK